MSNIIEIGQHRRNYSRMKIYCYRRNQSAEQHQQHPEQQEVATIADHRRSSIGVYEEIDNEV